MYGSGGAAAAAIGAWLTAVRGANQCVSLRQPGGVIQVVTQTDGGTLPCALTITGTVVLGKEKTVDLPL